MGTGAEKVKLSMKMGPGLEGRKASKLWWRRLLRVPGTARSSNQSILKEINSEYSLEGLMLKLKLQYFGHLMQRVDSLEKTLMLGGIGGRRRRGPQVVLVVNNPLANAGRQETWVRSLGWEDPLAQSLWHPLVKGASHL